MGALSAEKDPVNAVEAIAWLPDVHLAMAGSGSERLAIERLAASIAPGRVSLLGQVMRPTQVYAAADAVVLSSRTEGLPGVLIEAGFSGLPVAATDVGYVRDIVDDGVTGFVAPPNDPAALGDAVRAALEASPALGQKARARCAALFDIGHVADSWDALLAESCGK